MRSGKEADDLGSVFRVLQGFLPRTDAGEKMLEFLDKHVIQVAHSLIEFLPRATSHEPQRIGAHIKREPTLVSENIHAMRCLPAHIIKREYAENARRVSKRYNRELAALEPKRMQRTSECGGPRDRTEKRPKIGNAVASRIKEHILPLPLSRPICRPPPRSSGARNMIPQCDCVRKRSPVPSRTEGLGEFPHSVVEEIIAGNHDCSSRPRRLRRKRIHSGTRMRQRVFNKHMGYGAKRAAGNRQVQARRRADKHRLRPKMPKRFSVEAHVF